LKQYHQLKDSIFNLDTKNELTQLEADYQVEKKNIELVRKDAEVVKQKSQRNIFIILTIAAAAILIGLVFFYNKIRKANNNLEEKNSQINQQKNELQTLNQVKDRLFSIISHDLRNPLATLKSYLSLADNDSLAPEKKLQFKLQTMNAVTNTSEMLDNLLAWANVQIKNTRATIVPISIEDLVWDTVQTLTLQATQKDIRIEQQLNVSKALGDYDILSIALRNITTNAIKYSNKGKRIQLNAERRGEDVVLSVHDEGIGMTAQQIDEILNDQTSSTQGTQNEKGSGLGLFLVKELLQKMNASLTIESTPGMGSTFNIILSAP
jgi:signal transduction histidine kinase